ANVQAALGYPVGQLLQIDLLPSRRNQNGLRPTLEFIFLDNTSREIPICSVSDNELDLVAIETQSRQIRPVITSSFAGGRTLNVKNDLRPEIDTFRRNIAASFNQHFITFSAQTLDQLECFALSQRLAAGDFN